MNVCKQQHDIVTKLQTSFDSLSLQYKSFDLPDAQSDFQKAVTQPIIYTVYTGSKALPSDSTRAVVQKRTLSFNVEVHARSLYASPNGVHAARDIVEQILIGYAPVNSEKIYLVKDDIIQANDNIWVHVLQIECITTLVQVSDDDPIVIPSLTELIFPD